VAVACFAAAGVTLTSYALTTWYLAQRIVQLPEYLRDYSYLGYTSPALYLSTHYVDLLGLQLFSWAITVSGLLVITGTAGLWLGRYRSGARAA
jgi:hypothetical protein